MTIFNVNIEGIGQGGTDNRNRVEAGAAIDIDIGVFNVDQRVDIDFAGIDHATLIIGIESATNVGDIGAEIGNLIVFIKGQQSADKEGVITIVAKQVDFRRIVVDFEVIVTLATKKASVGEIDAVGNLGHHLNNLTFDQGIRGSQY